LLLFGVAASAAPKISLSRIDCGTEPDRPRSFFSDTYAFGADLIQLVDSCYLIRHGDDYLLWEAGTRLGEPARYKPLTRIFDEAGLPMNRIKYLGISHFHSDHIAQAGALPRATLLIGKADWEVLSAPRPPADRGNDQQGFENWRAPFNPWVAGGSHVKALTGDEDVFGDGTVMMLAMPGHTPGHYVLLVRLERAGAFLLSGDLAHFHENYQDNGVPPTWGFDRADSLASLDRFKRIAANLRATVIIQHDARDIAKLPAFPEAAE
jgi:N-acyl homoserine lactone hydrolase